MALDENIENTIILCLLSLFWTERSCLLHKNFHFPPKLESPRTMYRPANVPKIYEYIDGLIVDVLNKRELRSSRLDARATMLLEPKEA